MVERVSLEHLIEVRFLGLEHVDNPVETVLHNL